MNQIQEFKKTEATLADLNARLALVPDAATKEGYEHCRAGIAELRGYRTGIDKLRLELNRDDQNRIKYRNGEAKRIVAALVELEDPMKAAKAEVDGREARMKREVAEAEEKRIEAIEGAIGGINKSVYCEQSVSALNEAIARIQGIDAESNFFAEFAPAAKMAQKTALDTLAGYLSKAVEAEAEAERVRVAAQEQKRIADEQLAAQARIDAERREIQRERDELAAKQAEGIRLAEEQKQQEIAEKQAAEKARQDEIDQQAEEKRLAAEERARLEADQKHVADILAEAKSSLMEFVGEATAKKVIQAIADGSISHITINY